MTTQNFDLSILQTGTILKLTEYKNVYFNIKNIDYSMPQTVYTLLECDVNGLAIRCPNKRVLETWQFEHHLVNGNLIVISGAITAPKKVTLLPYQKRKLLAFAKSINSLKSTVFNTNLTHHSQGWLNKKQQ